MVFYLIRYNILANRKKMKCILILLICITFPFQIGKGNTSQIYGIESTISIKAQGKTYFVVQLFSRFTEDGEYIKSLHVEKNKKTIANINFPSSEDIKNFSVNIKKQRKNCILECFYGGGDNFYSRLFYFRCAKDNLYLYKIIETHTIVNSDKVITKKQYMQPQINITKFNILNYIENTP